MKKYNNAMVFAACCAGMMIFGIAFLSLGTLSTFIQTRLGPSGTASASLASSLPFGMLAGNILFGPLADRYGFTYILIVSSLLIIAGFEMVAFLPTLSYSVLSFFLIGMEGITSNWTTTYLGAAGTPVSKALFALSVQVAALVVARLALSVLLKRISPGWVLVSGISLIISGALLMFFSSSFLEVVGSLILFGFGFASGFPVILGYTGEIFLRLSGTAFSIVIIMALIGNTFLNYMTGLMSVLGNIRYFPLLIAGSALIMLILFRGTLPFIHKKKDTFDQLG